MKHKAKFIARFVPQAWLNDYAIEVDPMGDTVWDCTREFDSLSEEYRNYLICGMDSDGFEVVDDSDCLKGDPDAPEWVREWQGPFTIYVGKTRY